VGKIYRCVLVGVVEKISFPHNANFISPPHTHTYRYNTTILDHQLTGASIPQTAVAQSPQTSPKTGVKGAQILLFLQKDHAIKQFVF